MNVEDPDQKRDYEALGQQDRFHVLFYDEGLRRRVVKTVAHPGKEDIGLILERAQAVLAGVP